MLTLAKYNKTEDLRIIFHQIKHTCAMVWLKEMELYLFLFENLLMQGTLSPAQIQQETTAIYKKMQQKKEILQRQHAALKAVLNT